MWKGIFDSKTATITFPTTLDEVQKEMRGLEEFGKRYGPVRGVDGEGSAQVLTGRVRVDDLNTEAGIQNLNQLAEVIDHMDSERLKFLSGALALERADDLNDVLRLPASAEQLEQAKRALEIEDSSQAVIAGVDYEAPSLNRLIPRDCITVEYANEMAQCLRRLKTDGEMMKYYAALEVEEPSTFTEALDMAIDIDDYEPISSSEREYGRQALIRMGANDEVLEAIEGHTDFDRLGSEMMEEDGVRQTGFGMVRRLSKPFSPEPEPGQQMGGLSR